MRVTLSGEEFETYIKREKYDKLKKMYIGDREELANMLNSLDSFYSSVERYTRQKKGFYNVQTEEFFKFISSELEDRKEHFYIKIKSIKNNISDLEFSR